MSEIVAAIRECAPGAEIEFDDAQLPFPFELEARELEGALDPQPATGLAVGVREPVERFRRSLPPRDI